MSSDGEWLTKTVGTVNPAVLIESNLNPTGIGFPWGHWKSTIGQMHLVQPQPPLSRVPVNKSLIVQLVVEERVIEYEF